MEFKMAPNDFRATHNVDSSDILRAAELELNILLDEASVYQQFIGAHPGSNPEQAKERFYAVLADLSAAINGVLPPNSDSYLTKYQAKSMHLQEQRRSILSRIISSPAAAEVSFSSLIESLKQSLPNRQATKNVTWSEEEHRLFLLGMDIHGKGDWKSISQHFVLSRTPSQIASHAQKYFKRLKKLEQTDRGFITKNRVFQQSGHTSKNTEIDVFVENSVPISEIPMPIVDVNAPFLYFQ